MILVCTSRLCAGSWTVCLRTSDYMLGQVYSTPASMRTALNALSHSLGNLRGAAVGLCLICIKLVLLGNVEVWY